MPAVPLLVGWLVVGVMEGLARAWSGGFGLVGFSLPSFFRERCCYGFTVPQLRAALLTSLPVVFFSDV